MTRNTASDGRRTVSNTITIVTRPACGIPAAPILAAVAVILNKDFNIKCNAYQLNKQI